MIIDFHTHIFPDKVAKHAIPKLASVIRYSPSMDGTTDGLLESMEQSGTDLSVVLPVVTDPHQFDSVIRFASELNETNAHKTGPRLLSFAGLHPVCDQYKQQLQLIAREGFKGIKLHPNYQGVFFDDIRYMRIVYTASELGLSVLVHAGADPYTPGELYCSPDMILRVLNEVAPPRLILAHMGNNENYEESEKKLCGKNVYMDTSYSLMRMPEDQLIRMIHIHGTDKILFGSDAPWSSQKDCVEKIKGLTGLSQKEKDQILWENASFLLGI